MAVKKGILVPDMQENMKQCVCGNCPTFKKSHLSVGFFCSKGKANEKVKRVVCMCRSCSTFKKFGLNIGIFCDRGKSADNP